MNDVIRHSCDLPVNAIAECVYEVVGYFNEFDKALRRFLKVGPQQIVPAVNELADSFDRLEALTFDDDE